MTATTDDLRELELELDFDAEQPAAPAAPAVPAYLSSAARRRAADAEQGDGFIKAMYGLSVLGLVISLGIFGLVSYDNSTAQLGEQTSVSTAP
jgi:hypothetical protein